jgi:hypothetical protein
MIARDEVVVTVQQKHLRWLSDHFTFQHPVAQRVRAALLPLLDPSGGAGKGAAQQVLLPLGMWHLAEIGNRLCNSVGDQTQRELADLLLLAEAVLRQRLATDHFLGSLRCLSDDDPCVPAQERLRPAPLRLPA